MKKTYGVISGEHDMTKCPVAKTLLYATILVAWIGLLVTVYQCGKEDGIKEEQKKHGVIAAAYFEMQPLTSYEEGYINEKKNK